MGYLFFLCFPLAMSVFLTFFPFCEDRYSFPQAQNHSYRIVLLSVPSCIQVLTLSHCLPLLLQDLNPSCHCVTLPRDFHARPLSRVNPSKQHRAPEEGWRDRWISSQGPTVLLRFSAQILYQSPVTLLSLCCCGSVPVCMLFLLIRLGSFPFTHFYFYFTCLEPLICVLILNFIFLVHVGSTQWSHSSWGGVGPRA